MTRFIIPVLVALAISGPAWADTNILVCEGKITCYSCTIFPKSFAVHNAVIKLNTNNSTVQIMDTYLSGNYIINNKKSDDYYSFIGMIQNRDPGIDGKVSGVLNRYTGKLTVVNADIKKTNRAKYIMELLCKKTKKLF